MLTLWSLGNATREGKTLQLRALGWNLNVGLQDFPVITIYHPFLAKLGNTFADVAWADDGTLQSLAEWHPCISNVVYHGMNWEYPTYQR